METIELIIEDLGYYNPDTGKNRPSIDGLNNKGKQKFKHRGHKHPELSIDYKQRIFKRIKKVGKWYIQLDITEEQVDSIINTEDVKFKIKKLTVQESIEVFTIVDV